MAKTEQIIIRLEPEQKEELRVLAAEQGRTVGNYIRWLITEKTKQRKLKKEKP